MTLPLEHLAWVDDRLTAAGRSRTAPPELHRSRTWACVYRVPTDTGPVWLKSMPPATAFEARLYAVLQRSVADLILEPLGADTRLGLLLLPDAGPSLHGRFGDRLPIEAVTAAVRAYAQLQQRTAGDLDDMLAAGVDDMRPDVLPRRFDQALDFVRSYVAVTGSDGDAATLERLVGLRPTYAHWCAELVDTGRSAALDHNDLHVENIVGTHEHPRFYDWGDAVVAHPFAALLTTLDTIPAVMRDDVESAYLGEFGDPEALRHEAVLARRVALVARAHVWLRALGDRPAEHEHAPFAHLARMLDRLTTS